MTGPASPLDFSFLQSQTFNDQELEREILALFVEQARRLVPRLSALALEEQTATAHLLKGSCLGIGATDAAELLQRYGDSGGTAREDQFAQVLAAFAAVERAIAAHLAAP